MKLSRQALYVLILSVILFLIVLFFSIFVLIPEGKTYRIYRLEAKKQNIILDQYTQLYDQTYAHLKELQSQNRYVLDASKNTFDPERFEKQHSVFFQNLKLQKVEQPTKENPYEIYKVSASSTIDSPASFYKFLDAINKGDWLISIAFPIDFERNGETINSTFSMRVYTLVDKKLRKEEDNATNTES